MARNERLVVRVNKQERQMLERLAAHLQRTQSDAVRLLVRGAAQEMGVVEQDDGREPVRAGQHE